MKKLLVIAVTAFLFTLFYSCKGHESCPAYGQVDDTTEIPT